MGSYTIAVNEIAASRREDHPAFLAMTGGQLHVFGE